MAGLLPASIATAAINIETVRVGNAGNVADNSYGSVDDNYYIGTYEVTNSQYTAFLNAVASMDTHGLYNANMGDSEHGGIVRSEIGSSGRYTYDVKTGMGEKPVNFVSFWDAARFSNWLTTGDTEIGVYQLSADGISNNTITRDDKAWVGGGVAVASQDEWYKAAYYDGNGQYSLYPTQSNSITTAKANYANSVGTVTDVGTYAASLSHYGTFDQGGNVHEWNDSILFDSNRGLRGGSFTDFAFNLGSSTRGLLDPDDEIFNVGFRVSSLEPIPEPSAYAAILGCFGLSLALVRRQRGGTL